MIYNDLKNDKYGNWYACTTHHVLKLLPSKIDLQSLRDWACGSYAIRLSLQYLHHANEFKYYRSTSHPLDIKITGIVSRFSSNKINPKMHKVYLRFSDDGNDVDLSGCFSYCTCKTGQRVCGGCAHTVAVLFILIHHLQSKPLPNILPRASLMENKFLDCLKYKKHTETTRLLSKPKPTPKRTYKRRKKKNKNTQPIAKRLRSSKSQVD